MGASILFQRVVQVLPSIGFLFALVIAWFHGEQGRQKVTGPDLRTATRHAQLIDGRPDQHLWAEECDRDLTVSHAIDIQDEVTNQVVRALSARILPEELARSMG